jgi:hypothetical protein
MGFTRPNGVTYFDPDLAYDTTVIFSGADGLTRLIDLHGDVVHEWPYAGLPPRILDPSLNNGRNGDVFLQLSNSSDCRGGIFANGTIGKVSWDGDVLWRWGKEAPGGAARQNHDWQQLPNGNWLVLVTELRVVEELSTKEIGDQGLVEIDPDGQVVWRWRSGDHVSELGLSKKGFQLLREAVERDADKSWGCLEMNSASTLGANKWDKTDSTKNPAFHPDNIIVSFRKANVVAIIEKSTGNFIWRIGPYFEEASGEQHERILRHDLPRPLDQISGQHNPHIIAEGLPGAGNILLFDCQGGAGYPQSSLGKYAGSRILEIDPTTKHIVWQYTAEDSGLPPWTFFSSFVSNAQRLPNGNTLITEGMNGRLFQVTWTGQAVWEYYSPYLRYGVAGEPEVRRPTRPEVERVTATPLVYRSYAVPYDWLPDSVVRASVVDVDIADDFVLVTNI